MSNEKMKWDEIMGEVLSGVQKFINSPFKYKDFISYLGKKKDVLLNKNVLDIATEPEYNALWDTMLDLEKYFVFANEDNLVVVSRVSVSAMFSHNKTQRTPV